MHTLTKHEILAVSGGFPGEAHDPYGDILGDLAWLHWLRTHQIQTGSEPVERQPVSRNPLP
jgi:hypothetical protein